MSVQLGYISFLFSVHLQRVTVENGEVGVKRNSTAKLVWQFDKRPLDYVQIELEFISTAKTCVITDTDTGCRRDLFRYGSRGNVDYGYPIIKYSFTITDVRYQDAGSFQLKAFFKNKNNQIRKSNKAVTALIVEGKF